MLLGANNGRLAGQRGVATATIAKTALTGLALAETGCSRALGAKLPQVRQVMTANMVNVTPSMSVADVPRK